MVRAALVLCASSRVALEAVGAEAGWPDAAVAVPDAVRDWAEADCDQRLRSWHDDDELPRGCARLWEIAMGLVLDLDARVFQTIHGTPPLL